MGQWFQRDLKVHCKWKALISIGMRQSQDLKKNNRKHTIEFLLQMTEVLFSFMENGKELQRQRNVPLPSFSMLIYTSTNGSINITLIETITSSGFTSTRPKMRVMSWNVHLEKWELWKRQPLVLWLHCDRVTGCHGAICQQELNHTKTAPEEAGGRALTAEEGKSTHRSSLFCE